MIRQAIHPATSFVNELAWQITKAYPALTDGEVESTVDGFDVHLEEITNAAKDLSMPRQELRDRVVAEVRRRISLPKDA